MGEGASLMRRAGMVLGVAVVWAALLLVGLSRVDRVVRATAPATRAVPEAERRELLGVVQRFNEIWSDFYASGGIPTMIDAMPASKMVKHGIFRDTGFLAGNGRYQVYDLAIETISHWDGRLDPEFRDVNAWKAGGLIERLPVSGSVRGRLRAIEQARQPFDLIFAYLMDGMAEAKDHHPVSFQDLQIAHGDIALSSADDPADDSPLGEVQFAYR